MDHQQKNYKTERARGLGRKNKRGDRKGESNDSPEIPDRRKTSDIPGFPSALGILEELWLAKIRGEKNPEVPTWWSPQPVLEDLALGAEMGLMISSTHDSTDPATSQSQDPLGHVHCTSKSCMHRTAMGVDNFHLHFNILCSLVQHYLTPQHCFLVHQLNSPQHSLFSGALAYIPQHSLFSHTLAYTTAFSVLLYTSSVCPMLHQLTPQHFIFRYTSLHHSFPQYTIAYTTAFSSTLAYTTAFSVFLYTSLHQNILFHYIQIPTPSHTFDFTTLLFKWSILGHTQSACSVLQLESNYLYLPCRCPSVPDAVSSPQVVVHPFTVDKVACV